MLKFQQRSEGDDNAKSTDTQGSFAPGPGTGRYNGRDTGAQMGKGKEDGVARAQWGRSQVAKEGWKQIYWALWAGAKALALTGVRGNAIGNIWADCWKVILLLNNNLFLPAIHGEKKQQ